METIIGKDMLNKSLPIGMVPILFSAAGAEAVFWFIYSPVITKNSFKVPIINNSIIDIFKSNNRLLVYRILRSNIIQNNLLTLTELPR
mgnify:FL=1